MQAKSDSPRPPKRTTRRDEIIAELRKQIDSGTLAPGVHLPSLREFCTLYQTSEATIRAAIRELEYLGYVQSRQGSGIYVLNRTKPETSSLKLLAMLINTSTDLFCARIIAGAQEACQAAGYRLILEHTQANPLLEAQQIESLSDSVAGLLIIPTTSCGNYEAYISLIKKEVPFVFLDRGVNQLSSPLVATDNQLGGFLATQTLLDAGVEEIFLISDQSSSEFSSTSKRIAGYRQALKLKGIPFAPQKLLKSEFIWDKAGYTETLKLLSSQTPKGRFGIFATNDYIARGCYVALREKGLRIPDDVVLCGFDDLASLHLDPPLSSVRQDLQGMGFQGAKLLMEMISSGLPPSLYIQENGNELVQLLPPHLVLRNSCHSDSFDLKTYLFEHPEGQS